MSRLIVQYPARVVMDSWRCNSGKCLGEMKCTGTRKGDFVHYIHRCTYCGRVEEASRPFPAFVPEQLPGSVEVGRAWQ